MLELRPFDRLGRFQNDWLNAHYHFSFADYFDPARMGWGALRVWNDDTIRAQTGFPPHGHRDMEIITYVRSGAISHQDSLGNSGRTAAGDVQVMSAGSGIQHAEYNKEDEDSTLFQIWIQTAQKAVPPRWETRQFPQREGAGFVPLASGREADLAQGALLIHQDAAILGANLAKGTKATYDLTGRRGYLVAAVGSVRVGGLTVGPRDGLAIEGEGLIEVDALDHAEVVLADVA